MEEFLSQPCLTFRAPPAFLRTPFRRAMRFALDQVLVQPSGADSDAGLRAWKLWLVLPRFLLHRPPGQDKVPQTVLRARFDASFGGRWFELLLLLLLLLQCDASTARIQARPPSRTRKLPLLPRTTSLPCCTERRGP